MWVEMWITLNFVHHDSPRVSRVECAECYKRTFLFVTYPTNAHSCHGTFMRWHIRDEVTWRRSAAVRDAAVVQGPRVAGVRWVRSTVNTAFWLCGA